MMRATWHDLTCECGNPLDVEYDGAGEASLSCANAMCKHHDKRFRPPGVVLEERRESTDGH